jgi:glycerophosphoryl diester phosphodiesterase
MAALAWLLQRLAGLCADASWWLTRALFAAAARWRMPRHARASPGRMALIAHRGASAALPENTRRAALAALDAGAHGTEYDLQQLADGTLVVLHDDTLRRTARSGTDPSLAHLLDVPVSQLRLQDVRLRLHVDVGGERLPTFEDMLTTLVARHPGRVSFCELKAGSGSGMVAEALRVARKVG